MLVKPDKYEKLVNYYGSEKKVKSRFLSANAEKEARNPTASFWIPLFEELKDFEKEVKILVSVFKKSNRKQQDFNELDSKITSLCKDNKIPKICIDYLEERDARGLYICGINLKLPFYGEYKIKI